MPQTGATNVTHNVTNVQTANTVVNITLPAGARGFSDTDLSHLTQQLLEHAFVHNAPAGPGNIHASLIQLAYRHPNDPSPPLFVTDDGRAFVREVVTVRGATVPVHVERPLEDALHEACRRGWDIMEGAWDNPRKRQALGIPLCKPALERRLSPQDVERIDDYIAEGCDAFELPYETPATRAFKRTAVDGAARALEVDAERPLVALPPGPGS